MRLKRQGKRNGKVVRARISTKLRANLRWRRGTLAAGWSRRVRIHFGHSTLVAVFPASFTTAVIWG
jgi:hypothetical protein